MSEIKISDEARACAALGVARWDKDIGMVDAVALQIQLLLNQRDEEISTLKKARTTHAGDCTFYSSLSNGEPTDGICTCGFGWQVYCLNGDGDAEQLVSQERQSVDEELKELGKDSARLRYALAHHLITSPRGKNYVLLTTGDIDTAMQDKEGKR